MNDKELALLTLAYTVKTSEFLTPDKFLKDYQKNKQVFKEIISQSNSDRKVFSFE